MPKTRSCGLLLLPALLLLLFLLTPSGGLSQEAPPGPEWIGVFQLDKGAGLIWIKDPGISHYLVYRRSTARKEFTLVGRSGSNRYTDTGLEPGLAYWYRLVGVDAGGRESRPSKEISFTSKAGARVVLTPPEWEGHLILEQGIGLKWEPQDPTTVAAYNIYRITPPREDSELVGSATVSHFIDDQVEDGREYRYRVTAVDIEFRETAPSAELAVVYRRGAVEVPQELPRLIWKPRKTARIEILKGGAGEELRFRGPTDVAVTGDGKLVVADSGNGMIQVFDRRGKHLFSFPVPPAEGASRAYPLGLDVDRDGNIYSTDAHQGRVLIFDPRGRVLRVLDLPRQHPGEKVGILDLCLSPAGRLLVVDNYNHRAALYRQTADFIGFVGLPGFGPGEFTSPSFCAVDGQGHFLVSESLGARLQLLDPDGQFLDSFGRYSREVGSLARPKGVAVDSRGRIFVADSWLCQIQAFDREGRYLFTLADEEGKPLDLGSPNGIFIDRDDWIYIAERLANRVQIRQILP